MINYCLPETILGYSRFLVKGRPLKPDTWQVPVFYLDFVKLREWEKSFHL